MISKELLGVVLSNYGISGVYPSYDESDVMTAVQYEIEEIVFEINIYELAHKCKEWAFKDEYSCMSRPRLFGGWICELMSDYGVEDTQFDAGTEPEAVIKACQWILDNKDT